MNGQGVIAVLAEQTQRHNFPLYPFSMVHAKRKCLLREVGEYNVYPHVGLSERQQDVHKQSRPDALPSLLQASHLSHLWATVVPASISGVGIEPCFLKLKMDADSTGSVFTYSYLSCLDFKPCLGRKGK